MTTAEIAETATGIAVARRAPLSRWIILRRVALAAYALAFVVACLTWGVPFARELVIAWTCGALACASIGRGTREIVRLVADWAPLFAILVVYDLSRGAADSLGAQVHTTEMIDADRWLFAGQVPTEWLQGHLLDAGQVHWWDVGFALVYSSHFIVPFAVAGILWARNRDWFLGYAKRLVTLSFAGLATYIAFPAVPPWMAAENGSLEGVSRSTAQGWQLIDLHAAQTIEKGQTTVNQVAAMPSLHAAFAALVAIYLWPRVHRAWRPLLVAYTLAMGLTLVATGEHYAIDVLLGWAYAGTVMAGWTWWERRRDSALLAPRSSLLAPRSSNE
ncbi:MAG: phosphatase PAP2 family protein [Actinomycetota bacterium]